MNPRNKRRALNGERLREVKQREANMEQAEMEGLHKVQNGGSKKRQQWEYRRENVFLQDIQEIANRCGKDGWELISVGPTTVKISELSTDMAPGAILVFKRPK